MGIEKDYASPLEDGGNNSSSYASTSATSSSKGLVLHLGVIDVPYVNLDDRKKVSKAKSGKANKPRPQKVKSGFQTTGDVAGFLENKYGVMQAFADANMDAIVSALEDSIEGAIEDLLMGAPVRANPFADAESGISNMFKDFLESGAIEGAGIAGVPTEAAIKGVNHRLKRSRGDRRPSFIDTGLYQGSAIAWID